MKNKKKILLSCDEANHVCDKTQYKEASLWEKIVLNLHLIYCSACRKYTTKNAKLTKLIKNPKVHTMDATEKEHLKEELKKRLAE